MADVEHYALVLVVETHDERLAETLKSLRRAGFAAVGVRTFEHAREQIAIDPPMVLVTEARLGSYSGLHLAYLARQRQTACQVVILGDLPDSSLERDALQAGAVVLARPLPAAALPAMLAMLIGSAAPPAATRQIDERRRIERRQLVIPGFAPERRLTDRRRLFFAPIT